MARYGAPRLAVAGQGKAWDRGLRPPIVSQPLNPRPSAILSGSYSFYNSIQGAVGSSCPSRAKPWHGWVNSGAPSIDPLGTASVRQGKHSHGAQGQWLVGHWHGEAFIAAASEVEERWGKQHSHGPACSAQVQRASARRVLVSMAKAKRGQLRSGTVGSAEAWYAVVWRGGQRQAKVRAARIWRGGPRFAMVRRGVASRALIWWAQASSGAHGIGRASQGKQYSFGTESLAGASSGAAWRGTQWFAKREPGNVMACEGVARWGQLRIGWICKAESGRGTASSIVAQSRVHEGRGGESYAMVSRCVARRGLAGSIARLWSAVFSKGQSSLAMACRGRASNGEASSIVEACTAQERRGQSRNGSGKVSRGKPGIGAHGRGEVRTAKVCTGKPSGDRACRALVGHGMARTNKGMARLALLRSGMAWSNNGRGEATPLV